MKRSHDTPLFIMLRDVKEEMEKREVRIEGQSYKQGMNFVVSIEYSIENPNTLF